MYHQNLLVFFPLAEAGWQILGKHDIDLVEPGNNIFWLAVWKCPSGSLSSK